MARLIVGLDGLALLRESRHAADPDPAAAAVLARLGGAAGVSVGLRSDRRSAQERDLKVLRATVQRDFQARIPPSLESVRIVTPLRPDVVVIGVERADSFGCEAGLDLALAGGVVGEAAAALREAGLDVMAEIDPDVDQVKALHRLGIAGACFVGTRLGAARSREVQARELDALEKSVRLATRLGLRTQVAHGLDLESARLVGRVQELETVLVGHAFIARACLSGMQAAAADFCAALR